MIYWIVLLSSIYKFNLIEVKYIIYNMYVHITPIIIFVQQISFNSLDHQTTYSYILKTI